MRHVRGVLFLDYVRMLRSQKSVDWKQWLFPQDVAYLVAKIDPDGWYPMETFERMGNEILRTIAQGQLHVVQLWGRHSAGQLAVANPTLLTPGDPIETLTRFHTLRQTFFDFPALEIPVLRDDEAQVIVHYHMGMPAEQAAACQTLGFFEGLVTLAGATVTSSSLVERSWDDGERTLFRVTWSRSRMN
ncbi:hypothetical protein BH11MYX1_BH11MYX1_06180 [soil metagenome]